MGTLVEQAKIIRDEEKKGANTSTRVGGLLVELSTQVEGMTDSYIQVAEWSGTVLEDAAIEYQSTLLSDPAKIVFIKSKGIFAYDMSDEYQTLYINNWGTLSLFQDFAFFEDKSHPILSKNIFHGSDDSIWIANGKSSIEILRIGAAGYKVIVEWSGELIDGDITFEEESTINVIPSEIYFSTTKNCFCVKRSDKYYNSWLNKDDSSGINGADYFVQNKAFTKNVFKGLDGSVWIADSSTSIKLVSKALDVIDGEYHENNKEAFQPIADKLLASSNFLARILYYFSDDKTYELVFFNGCIPERSYGFSTVYPLMVVGVSSTGKIFMMHRYNKQIEIFKAQ